MGEVSKGGPVPIHSLGRELAEEERQQELREAGERERLAARVDRAHRRGWRFWRRRTPAD
jgi:hypothetical protein